MMRGLSLTAKLAGTFTLITLTIFCTVGGYLYNDLSERLFDQDDEAIVLKAEHWRRHVSYESSVVSLKENIARFASQIVGNDDYVVQLRSSDGQLLMEFNPMRLPTAASPVVRIQDHITRKSLRDWRTDHGAPIHGISVHSRLQNGEVVTVIIGRSISEHFDLLKNYKYTIAASVIFGAFATLALGVILVSQTLRPLLQTATEVERITASRLNARLDESNAPAELRGLTASLNKMLTRLEEGFKRLSQFTSDLAHDMRTPVSNLRGQTEVALSRTRTIEEYKELLESNVEEYDRLARMIENILFLARADDAKISLKRETLNLQELLTQVANYFEGLAQDRGLAISVRAVGTVFADGILFRRAVSNLLINALNHTPSGGVVELTTAKKSRAALVHVSNPGCGIPPEQLDKVFERFYRLDSARSNSSDSAGLGLAIVKSIMELHQGRASIVSQLDGTTQFTLVFPDSN